MIIERSIKNKLITGLKAGKVVIVYGARQVGKTTLVKQVASELYPDGNFLYLNGEDPYINDNLVGKSAVELKAFIGDYPLVIIDEAQKVQDIGLTLKLLHDTYPSVQLLVTGSSSLSLANKTAEPLTGRSFRYKLYPFSLTELANALSKSKVEARLEELLIYGAYPEVFLAATVDKVRILSELASNYLYKDILEFEGVKDSDFVRDLLKALAFQLGNEVSVNELANLLGVSKDKIKRYLDLLEKAFIIYRLRPLARRRRKEIVKNTKIYFYDLGIRNYLISNFAEMDLRTDRGALWENFCINERFKFYQTQDITPNTYFWRNYYGAEVDFIEEWNGEIRGFEFKWRKKTFTKPKAFFEAYENASIKLINRTKLFSLTQPYEKIP